MKKIKNLFIALLTLISLNSFSQITTQTVTYGSTSSVTVSVGDVLKFYGTVSSIYGVQINGTMVINLLTVNPPYFIGSYTITGGETNFTIQSSVPWSGTIKVKTTPPPVDTTTVITVGIKSITKSISNLVVFPNPSVGDVNVKFNSTTMTNDVVILDMIGRVVLKNTGERLIGENVLEVNGLSTGMYFVKVDNEVFRIVVR